MLTPLLKRLPAITSQQIQHFFEHYRDLEPGKWVESDRWGDAAGSRKTIQEALDRVT